MSVRLGKRERAEKKARLARIARVDDCPIRTSLQELRIVGRPAVQWQWQPKKGPKPKVRLIPVE